MKLELSLALSDYRPTHRRRQEIQCDAKPLVNSMPISVAWLKCLVLQKNLNKIKLQFINADSMSDE